MTRIDLASADSVQLHGMPKDATPDEIKAKYRTLAKKWHPDLFTGVADKAAAEAEF